jgi:hypothetical protein
MQHMNQKIVGRVEERAILMEALTSNEAELISIIGRRRVGKTFLVNQVYQGQIIFQLTGTHRAPKKEQLQNFAYALQLSAQNSLMITLPNNWMEAFFLLIKYLQDKVGAEKQVVFFDELPWLSTHRSGFVRALSYFWNSWAVNQNIVVVICGSAASWMIQKIVNDKGGLHNRITKRLHLKPFNLYETEEYLRTRLIKLPRYQILQLYMTMGGIPHYLKEIKPGLSAQQNIGSICFSETGLLRDEFTNLYAALFDYSEYHIAVVRALAKKRNGMTRNDLVSEGQMQSGGGLSKAIEELHQSGFISEHLSFGKRVKDKQYRLIDEYSLFYLRFIEQNKANGADVWQALSQTQKYKIWCGYSFENICLKHVAEVKLALSIAGVYTQVSSFITKGSKDKDGAQIDLILDRKDQSINLCEIKFYNKSVILTKSMAQKLRHKVEVFEQVTQTKKQIFVTFITTFGLEINEQSIGLVDHVLTLDDLF